MKKIYLVGGNGFARECAAYVIELSQRDPDIVFGGFIGHNGYEVDYKGMQYWFKGDLSRYVFQDEDYCVIGAGFPELRVQIYDDLKAKNAKLINLVLAGSYLDPSVEIGEGNIFIPPFRASVDMKIGNGNVFNGDVITGHDDVIGDFNFFGPRSQILGNVRVGSFNVVGAGAVLLPNSKMGDHNKVSPLSAVYKGCRDHCYMHGNPAIKTGVVE